MSGTWKLQEVTEAKFIEGESRVRLTLKDGQVLKTLAGRLWHYNPHWQDIPAWGRNVYIQLDARTGFVRQIRGTEPEPSQPPGSFLPVTEGRRISPLVVNTAPARDHQLADAMIAEGKAERIKQFHAQMFD